jgi:hypothetical protein
VVTLIFMQACETVSAGVLLNPLIHWVQVCKLPWLSVAFLKFILNCYILEIAFFYEFYEKFVILTWFWDVWLKNAVFWDVASRRSCVNRCFGGTYYLHLQGRKIRERGSKHLLTLVPRSWIFLRRRWGTIGGRSLCWNMNKIHAPISAIHVLH